MQAAGDLELSSLPVGPPTEHWLNLITKKMDIGPDAVEDLTNAVRRASMKGDSQGLGIDAPANGMPAGRTRVFACVNLHELRNIDPANESFEVRTRLYLCWRPPILHMSPLDDRPMLESDEEMDDGEPEAQSASGSGFDPVKASTGVAAADPAAGSGQGELPRGLHANGHGPGSESQRKSVARSSRTGRRFTMLQKVLRYHSAGTSVGSESLCPEEILLEMQRIAWRAREQGKRVCLSDEEVERMLKILNVPKLSWMNAADQEETDSLPSLRIYWTHGAPMVMYNMGYKLTMKEHFELENFPFDTQDLYLHLAQNDSRTWDDFDLAVVSVLFSKSSLEMAEWHLHEPIVQRASGSSAHKSTTIRLQARREPGFYLANIVGIMLMLSVLGLTLFALPRDQFGERINVVLTLLLTAVAFKFAIADSIPKVGYNTLLDDFILLNMYFLFCTGIICLGAYILEDAFDGADGLALPSGGVMLAALLPRGLLGPVAADESAGVESNALQLSTQLLQHLGGYSVNTAGLAVSLIVFAAILLTWYYRMRRAVSNEESTRAIEKKEGTNWYNYIYGAADVLPVPQRHGSAKPKQV